MITIAAFTGRFVLLQPTMLAFHSTSSHPLHSTTFYFNRVRPQHGGIAVSSVVHAPTATASYIPSPSCGEGCRGLKCLW
ncbi:hypothetical protein K504DRAFT_466130 [Pleomassaria siparia CBS 279.74]|uniref:Uncharacterized protein n=1 Tax=Pleomassaria siparia CBS 279.74 TaxID=1314801 RepID=A0A6G1KFC0_9PLEO|nr:hypothetical protein K504DRAFT_466130 [Pleomassaria siparia CBS 279.74]